jgi:response regulator NasT
MAHDPPTSASLHFQGSKFMSKSTSLRVLIADDESIIRMGLRTILTELGHTVYSAADGMEAVSLAQREDLDLALLDIRMPFKDGLEAASDIVKHRPIPIVILTAYNDNTLLDRAAAIPVQGYLVKPVKRDDLITTMRVALATHQDRSSLSAKVGELEEKLTARKLIDRAKGVLQKQGMSEEEAYHQIQMAARSRRTTMSKIATEIIEKGDK